MNVRNVLRILRRGLLCLAASALLWSWIFNFLTDAGRENKIVVYADMKDFRWKELAAALEENAPEGIRFVQVHPFGYAMMNSADLEQADLYIMTASQAWEYAGLIAPPREDLPAQFGPEPLGNGLQGVPLRRAGSDSAAASAYLSYGERPDESWYLFPGAASLHWRSAENSLDDAALETAGRLLEIR